MRQVFTLAVAVGWQVAAAAGVDDMANASKAAMIMMATLPWLLRCGGGATQVVLSLAAISFIILPPLYGRGDARW